jgi:hypothetical protein
MGDGREKKPRCHPGGDAELPRLEHDVAASSVARKFGLRIVGHELHHVAVLVPDFEQPANRAVPGQ